MIKAMDIVNLCSSAGLGQAMMRVCDGTYGVATLDYLIKDFPQWWKQKLDDRGLGNWETTWDCDNFAWSYFTDLQWAHYATKKSTAEGLAVGVIYYMADARSESGVSGGHAINIAVVEKNGRNEVIFIEPQFAALGRPCILNLARHEIQSAWLVNF